jgi:hypothetical protein
MYGINLGYADGRMNPKKLVEALVGAADSDAADNKPKRDADTEQSYSATRLSLFSHRHDFKP